MERQREFDSARKTVQKKLSNSKKKVLQTFHDSISFQSQHSHRSQTPFQSRLLKSNSQRNYANLSNIDGQNYISPLGNIRTLKNTIKRDDANQVTHNKYFISQSNNQSHVHSKKHSNCYSVNRRSSQTNSQKKTDFLRQSQQINSISHSQYMCINCVNHSLSKQKKLREHQQQSEIKRRELLFTATFHIANKNNDQQKQVRDYNKRIIESKQAFKIEQGKNKKIEEKLYKKKLQVEECQRKQIKNVNLAKRQKWKQQIKAQISLKKNKTQKQQQEKSKRESAERMKILQYYQTKQKIKKQKIKAQKKYRDQLLQQIKIKQNNAQKLQKKQKIITEQSFDEQEVRRKQHLLKEARAREINKNMFIQNKILKNQHQKQRLIEAKEQINKQENEYVNEVAEKMTNNKIKYLKYLKDLNQQIIQKRLKDQQHRPHHYFKEKNIVEDQKIIKKSCKECEKKYPLGYLTKVK